MKHWFLFLAVCLSLFVVPVVAYMDDPYYVKATYTGDGTALVDQFSTDTNFDASTIYIYPRGYVWFNTQPYGDAVLIDVTLNSISILDKMNGNKLYFKPEEYSWMDYDKINKLVFVFSCCNVTPTPTVTHPPTPTVTPTVTTTPTTTVTPTVTPTVTTTTTTPTVTPTTNVTPTVTVTTTPTTSVTPTVTPTTNVTPTVTVTVTPTTNVTPTVTVTTTPTTNVTPTVTPTINATPTVTVTATPTTNVTPTVTVTATPTTNVTPTVTVTTTPTVTVTPTPTVTFPPGNYDDNITVFSGWNLISIPKRITNNTAQDVFGPLNTDAHSIYIFDNPQNKWIPLTSVSNILPLDGFFVYSVSNTDIPIEYDKYPVQVPPSKHLYSKWNSFGFTGLTPLEAKVALFTLDNKWAHIIGFDAKNQTYENAIINGGTGVYSDTRILKPMKGYLIFMKDEILTGALGA